MHGKGMLEYRSMGVLGLRTEKYLSFVLSPLLSRDSNIVHICPLSQPFITPLLHHSITPIPLMILTTSLNKEWMTAVHQQP
jgi:hypothetical protein